MRTSSILIDWRRVKIITDRHKHTCEIKHTVIQTNARLFKTEKKNFLCVFHLPSHTDNNRSHLPFKSHMKHNSMILTQHTTLHPFIITVLLLHQISLSVTNTHIHKEPFTYKRYTTITCRHVFLHKKLTVCHSWSDQNHIRFLCWCVSHLLTHTWAYWYCTRIKT